jgi:hypothetical protein
MWDDALLDPFHTRALCAPGAVGLGDLRKEHLSRQGFAGPVAMLYRTDGPNEVVRFEGDYRPRQVDSADVVAPDADGSRRRALSY